MDTKKLFLAISIWIPASLLAPSGRGSYQDEANDLQTIRTALYFARIPVTLAVGVVDKKLGTGLDSVWHYIPDVLVSTRELIALIRDLLPLIKKTEQMVKNSLEALKAADLKEKQAGTEGVNTIYAIGYGIDALEALIPLLKEISLPNGLLTTISKLLATIAKFLAPFDEEQGIKVRTAVQTLESVKELLIAKVIPQLEVMLPGMKRDFNAIFGQAK